MNDNFDKMCVTRANRLVELINPLVSSFGIISSEHNVEADEVAIDIKYIEGAKRIGRTRIFARLWIHGDSRTDDIRISPTLYYDIEKAGIVNVFTYDHPPVLSKGYYYLCLISPDNIGVVKNLLAAVAAYEDIVNDTDIILERYRDMVNRFISEMSDNVIMDNFS